MSFVLYSRPFLDTYNQCYKNIVTINIVPKGPLNKFVRRVQFPPLSEFKYPSSCQNNLGLCGLALRSLRNDYYNGVSGGCCDLMVVDEIPDLFSFLLSHGYKIDTSLTKMMAQSDVRFQTNNANKVICFVTYVGQ